MGNSSSVKSKFSPGELRAMRKVLLVMNLSAGGGMRIGSLRSSLQSLFCSSNASPDK